MCIRDSADTEQNSTAQTSSGSFDRAKAEEEFALVNQKRSENVSYTHLSNNYIDSLAPGETVTVHWAFAVPEKKLGEMYFDLGNTCNLTSDLTDGYVTDIRQQEQ